jgi:hypothetical protein
MHKGLGKVTADEPLKSIYAHGLSDAEFETVGRIIIEFASIEWNVGKFLELVGKTPPQNVSDRMKELRKVMRGVDDERAKFFAAEFRWAMDATADVRNLLAHGMLLYPLEKGTGPIELWRQNMAQKIALPDALAVLPLVHYASHCLAHLDWHCHNIKPPKPFPERPSLSSISKVQRT